MQIENIYKKHSECTIILINIYKYDSITIRICNAKGAYKMKESAARMRRTQYRAQKILEAAGFEEIRVIRDLADKDRVIRARKPCTED